MTTLTTSDALVNLRTEVLKLSMIPPNWWKTLDEVVENFTNADKVDIKPLLACIELIGVEETESVILASAPEECPQCQALEISPGYFKLEHPCGFHKFTDGWV